MKNYLKFSSNFKVTILASLILTTSVLAQVYPQTTGFTTPTTTAQVDKPQEKDFAGTYGVGSGVVAIIVFIFIGMCVCCIGKATETPMYLAIVGTLLPIIVLIIIYFLPKEADKPIAKNVGTDALPILFFVFYILILLFAFIALVKLMLIYLCAMNKAYSLDTGNASITAAYIDNNDNDDETEIKRDRSKYMTKPQIDAKEYHKVNVRPENWRNKNKNDDSDSVDQGITGAMLQRNRRGRGGKLPPMNDRPGITDRIGVSGKKDKIGRVRPILTQDGGMIDGRNDYQYGEEDEDGRNLNMNIDVRDPTRHGERELDMTDDGVYQRLIRTQNLQNQLPDNFFLD